jgi:hypothetical protein
MGSEISLSVGNLDVDWGKNEFFNPHGALFQEGDIRQVPYRYVDDRGNPVRLNKPAYVRSLGDIFPRLELLGFGLKAAETAYEDLRTRNGSNIALKFRDLLAALTKIDLTKLSAEYEKGYEFGEFFLEEIYPRLGLDRFFKGKKPYPSDLGEVFGNLHPWFVIRLLCQKKSNLSVPVTWYFSDLVANGWADEEDFRPGLSPDQRFLLVTEGSSDAKIIQKAINLLHPEVSDFFYFVDMEEGYPFTGTGNLHKFCQGLASIGMLNRVLVIYDNDAEGTGKCVDTCALSLPENMKVVRLPDLIDFEIFPTLGPSGSAKENINGKAASIECYLDLQWKNTRVENPSIRWTLFNDKLQRYHGVLLGKERYTKRFLSLRKIEPNYDFKKIKTVTEMIIAECAKMANGT